MRPEREAAFEARLARLEARVKELESLVDRPLAVPPASAAHAVPPASPVLGAPTIAARPVVLTQPAGTAPTAPSTADPSGPVVGWVVPKGVVAGKMPWAPTRSVPHAPQRPAFAWSDLEARLTGRALAWVGGIALVLGAMFFVGLAFTRGWISEELRVVVGLAAGAMALAVGGVLMERQNRLIGHVLAPVGLAVISISMVGATRLYDLVPVWAGLLVVLASAISAAAIAIRSNSPVVAGFGLVAVLAAPPLMGASPDMVTLSFIATVLIGTTAVALWRSWPWLPPIAFLLAAPQAAAWIQGDPEVAAALVGIGSFWGLNMLAAAGEEVRRRRPDLSPSSASLLLANTAFLV